MRMAACLLLGTLLSGCATWDRTEINTALGQSYDAWHVPVFELDATVPITPRVAVKAGHISDPTSRGPGDPNLTWAGIQLKVK